MLDIEKPVILTGDSGVGKSALVANLLKELKETKKINSINLNFSAQTKAKEVQLAIEAKLQKKGKAMFGARPNETICIFVDDINMPALEFYGAQPCI
jgi:dynein heavy chain